MTSTRITNRCTGFLLKHDMIIANRGATGLAFEKWTVADDPKAIPAIQILAQRIKNLKDVII